MSRWVSYIGPGGRESLVRRNEAIRLIKAGAKSAGMWRGRNLIIAQNIGEMRELRQVTQKICGENIGFTGMQLVGR